MYRERYPVTYYFYPLLNHSYELNAQDATITAMLQQEHVSPPESLLYIHIPYCHDLCQFCPFHVKVASDDELYARYTASLCREMELLARYPGVADRTFSVVYFGGGSPSIFPVRLIARIFATMRRCFRIAPDAEISFEGEPRTLADMALLELLKEQRVARLSFGLQTFDPVQRERFKINATLADVERVTARARELRFQELNVDMMYDLPGQTIRALEQDIDALGRAGYDSVDYYNLHYYAFPKSFVKAMKSGEIPAKPSADMHSALAMQLRWRLAELGYRTVADQVYSKSGAVSEYFRLLWGGGYGAHAAETIAVGSSARGFVQGVSYMNISSAASYMARVEEGHLPVAKTSSSLQAPENRGAVFMVKFFRLEKRYDAAFRSVPESLWQAWRDSGMIYETDNAWEVSEHGRLWTTNMMFDAFEASQKQLASSSLVTIGKKPGGRTGTF